MCWKTSAPIWLLGLLAFTALLFSDRADGASKVQSVRGRPLPVDTLRWQLLGLFRNKTIASDMDLIAAFRDFGDAVEKVFPRGKRQLPPQALLKDNQAWARAVSDAIGINGLYDSFRRYQTSPSKLAGTDLTHTVLYDKEHSVPDACENIFRLTVQENNLFLEALKDASTTTCTLRQSPQQTIYQLYTAVALAELRGYSMMQFSYMLLKLYGKGNFTLETQLMRARYEERLTATANAARAAMENASRNLWRCDPDRHEEGETYLQVTRLLQGFVENEVNLNTQNTCKETCSFYKYAQVEGCYKDGFCAQQPNCNGKILKCQYIDSDMWVCPADYKTSNRRYDWIEYENGRQLGKVGSCNQRTTKVDSWWRWLFWHCSYCMCICDEQSHKSDRFFNLRETLADTSSNMVVTGLRFVKKNRVIHLQIQEAALLPQGNINVTSLRWKPVDGYSIDDRNIHSGVDYHTMTWDKRAMDLDDLIVPEGYVVTGIRFRMVGSHLNLEVQGSPMNFTSGELDDPEMKSHWISNDNTDASYVKPRTRVPLRAPDVPTRAKTPSTIDSRSDQYVVFTNSDIDADAAQTTVPFLDAQDTTPAAPVPLAGAGLYHKGQKGFGGFVGPKLITYDYSRHVYVEFPDEEEPVIAVQPDAQ